MRTSEGPLAEFAGVETASAYGRDRGNFQRLGLRERRKKPRKSLREHALSRPWRPDHQQAVFAGGGEHSGVLLSHGNGTLRRLQIDTHRDQGADSGRHSLIDRLMPARHLFEVSVGVYEAGTADARTDSLSSRGKSAFPVSISAPT